jgi:hypothetical protein
MTPLPRIADGTRPLTRAAQRGRPAPRPPTSGRGRARATDTRDSGIWPARCWPHWGGPGMDERPRGDAPTSSLFSFFEPTFLKTGAKRPTFLSGSPHPPRILLGGGGLKPKGRMPAESSQEGRARAQRTLHGP